MHFALRSSPRSAIRATHPMTATAAAPLAGLAVLIALAGCAAPGPTALAPPASGPAGRNAITAALHDGQPDAARKLLASALRAEPRNGYLHLLNGLTYQLADPSPQSAELAQVGYDAAVKFAPGYFWSHYYAGLAKFHQQEYPAAAEEFSWAILDRPDQPQAFAGLAAAAYYAGDLGVARLAAERAMALAPEDPAALRLVAYVAAASGDEGQVTTVTRKARSLSPKSAGLVADPSRLALLLRTAAAEGPAQRAGAALAQAQPASGDAQPPASGAQPPAGDALPPASNLQQVMVEVTLLLSQTATTDTVGINLLDGLKLQFSGDNKTTRNRATGVADTFSRVITSALGVPQITYSLNLFNTHEDFYDVVVRPSLVASLGQQSEFFIGRNLSVSVSGINAGALQTIDVGTSVKLTPLEISPERTKFRVDTVRSFFVPTSSGTFAQSVTTFKQTVGATAEVDFGKTLILSGLYEAVNVGWTSKVPVLGDIPIGNLLFNERSKTQNRDAAIVLVTPRLTGTLGTDSREFRAETLKRLLSLWKDVVDPLASTDALIETIRKNTSRHFRPQSGDLSLPAAADPATARLAIGDTLGRLR